MTVWLGASGVGRQRLADARSKLRRAGLEPVRTPSPPGSQPGLLLFGTYSSELRRSVEEYCRDGGARLLAVGMGAKAATPRESWRLLASGASDVLTWSEGASVPEAIHAKLERWREVDALVDSPLVREQLVGASRAWVSALRRVVELARFSASSALILGATGTGKELMARLVHTLDARQDKGELVLVDCTTLKPDLSGSELFGHEKGAFTGALAARQGALALADRGTLFLDEVGDLPRRLQPELLRAVQERSYKRVGGNTWRETDFRLVCATNRNLAEAVEAGTFRRDLYYRIATWTIRLPSLDERREDVLPLARHFLREAIPEGELPDFDPAVREHLVCRRYPGNVRDLRQLVLQTGHRHVGPGPVTLGDLPEDERPAAAADEPGWPDADFRRSVRRALATGRTMKQISAAAADTAVEVVLEDREAGVKEAARRLGVTPRALQLRRAARRADTDSRSEPDRDT